MGEDLTRLIKSALKLATLPEIYYRIDQAVEDPHSSLEDIGAIILEDPVLSARLLKIANSSLYSFPQPVETITRALTVVGTRQLRDLVMATAAMNLFKGVSPKLVNMRSFWQHAMATGLAARVIATCRREANVESFYVSGLLHDIGRLVLYMERPKQALKALRHCRQEGKLMHTVERDLMGFDHADVGWALLKRWGLPERLCAPVAWHHDPEGAEEFAMEAAVVHVANVIALAMRLGSSGERFVPPLDGHAWDLLELPVNALPTIFQQVDSQFADAMALFVDAG